MPPSPQHIAEQYSGTLIRDIESQVCRVESGLDPRIYLADVLSHLADKVMDAGDVQAWYLLRDLQECFWSGKTRRCVRVGCGQIEGMHKSGLYGCFRFLSMEESYQAALESACGVGEA